MLLISNMHGIDIKHVDLNLLVVLEVLLAERNVSRAAKRLRLSQSATSHALARLRKQFGDTLLVRSRAGMLLTPRAERLQGALKAQLAGVASLLSDDARFDPAALSGTVHLVCEDYVGTVILPRVLKRLGAEAPDLDLDIHTTPWNVYEGLENNTFDLALGAFGDAPATTRIRTLLHDDFVCLVRRGHPAVKKRLSLRQYVAMPHVVIGIGQPGPTQIDRALAKRRLARRVALRIPSFLAAPFVVAESDLVLTLPRRLAEQLRRLAPLEVHAPPLPLERFHFRLAWHVRRHDEPAHRWLRSLVAEVAAAL